MLKNNTFRNTTYARISGFPKSWFRNLYIIKKYLHFIFQAVNSCCSSPDGAYKIVHQCAPTQNSKSTKNLQNLQMVTQTLHIPPSSEISEANLETEKLRKEVKKLREYYR